MDQYENENNECYVCKNQLNKKLVGDMNTNVCLNCRKTKNIFISKTRAKKEYKLDDNNLDNLFSFEVKSVTYGRSQTITLFIEKEVEELSDKIYDGRLEEILEQKQRQKEQRKLAREEKKNVLRNRRREQIEQIFNNNGKQYVDDPIFDLYIEYGFKIPKTKRINGCIDDEEDLENAVDRISNKATRKKSLIAKLKERGLTLRSDSVLCNAYISGGMYKVQEINDDFESVDDIVDKMEEMHFLHKHTNYKNITDTNFENNRKKDYFLRMDKDEILERSKYDAIYQYIKNNGPIDKIPKTLQSEKDRAIYNMKKSEKINDNNKVVKSKKTKIEKSNNIATK